MNVYLGEIMDTPEPMNESLSVCLYTESEMAELPISTAHRKVCTQIP